MITTNLEPKWLEPDPDTESSTTGRWGLTVTNAGPADALACLLVGHGNEVAGIDARLNWIEAVTSGQINPGWVGHDHGLRIAYGRGSFYLVDEHDKRRQMVVSNIQLREAFHWLRHLALHPDATDPDGRISPLTVTIEATGPGADRRFREQGGSFFSTSYPGPGQHT